MNRVTRALPWIFLFTSLMIQVLFVFEQQGKETTSFFRDHPAFDSYRWISAAKIIIEKGYFPALPEVGSYPLYPLLVSAFFRLFGNDYLPLLLFQCFTGTVMLGLLYLTAKEWFGGPAALISLCVGCFYGPFVFFSSFYIRDMLIVFCTVGVVYGLTFCRRHWIYALLAGVFMALLSALRAYPIPLFFTALWFMFMLLRHRQKRWLGLAAVFSLSLLSTSLLMGTEHYLNPFDTIKQNVFLGNLLSSHYGIAWWNNISTPPPGTGESGTFGETVSVVSREIVNNPFRYVEFYLTKTRMILGDFEFPSNYNFYLFREELSWVIWIPFISLGMVAPFAVIGLWARRVDMKDNPILFLWLVAEFATLIFFIVQERYRLPMVPFIILFAGQGIVYIFNAVAEGRVQTAAYVSSAVLAMVFFCRFNPLPLPAAIGSPDYQNLASAYQIAGNKEKARYYELMQKQVSLREGIPLQNP